MTAKTATETRPTLSREAVIDRALALADSDSLESVTIRRLAADFGVTPMALYWHVKSKDELLESMGDRVLAAITVPSAPQGEWPDRLREALTALVDALRAHPASVQLAMHRVLACPEGLALTEYTLGMLREAGFSVRQSADVATQALHTAMMLVSLEPGAEAATAHQERDEVLARKRAGLASLPADQFPHLLAAVDDLLGCDTENYFNFGVEMFVAGAQATLAAGSRA